MCMLSEKIKGFSERYMQIVHTASEISQHWCFIYDWSTIQIATSQCKLQIDGMFYTVWISHSFVSQLKQADICGRKTIFCIFDMTYYSQQASKQHNTLPCAHKSSVNRPMPTRLEKTGTTDQCIFICHDYFWWHWNSHKLMIAHWRFYAISYVWLIVWWVVMLSWRM